MIYLPNYASALRCIGQALEQKSIDFFELTIAEPGQFLVEYGDPNPPHTSVFRIQFSPDSIKIMDREGQALRGQTKWEFRFDSLSETLRAIGRWLDSKRAQLRRLSNCWSSESGDIELEYQTVTGEVQSETLARSFIREIGVDMYQRRSRISNPINLVTRRN